jgi:hypothetical protein
MEESQQLQNKRMEVYQSNMTTYQLVIDQLKKQAKQWVLIRLFSFLLIPLTIYFLYDLGWIAALMVLAELIAFLYFVRKSAENKDHLVFNKKLLWINEKEIKALQHDYSAFSDGKKYNDPKHAFSYDMDLFGKMGFFQYFNRTVSEEGEKLLVNKLLHGDANFSANHDAIEELTTHLKWSQEFRARGIQDNYESDLSLSLLHWTKKIVNAPNWTKIMRPVIIVAAIGVTVAYNLDLINGTLFLLSAVIILAPISQLVKSTNTTHKELAIIAPRLSAIAHQLERMDEIDFKSEKLAYFKKQLFSKDQKGFEAVSELNKIIEQFEYRNNILVALLLNFYFAWDFTCLLRLKKWKTRYGDLLPGWEAIVHEIEVLLCAANFRYNHKNTTTYAELTDAAETKMECIGVGHPLIPNEKRISNDYIMKANEQFSIITGPNMAGKSTFLRSIAINLMLAKAGFPVMAEKFIFPNLSLYSSMRTSDDLTDESSYFHAELIRLRFIVDVIERGEKVFIILDEILKGTNSKDKEEGSAKFLSKLIQLKTHGIIATHDLKLTELADKNVALKNLYFDTTIEVDEISFDYTIREGVAKNMNASFLLRKMGLSS